MPETIDIHHHFWDLSRLDYPWIPPGPSVVRPNYLPPDLRPYVAQVGEQFGMDRLMFGSDWPVCLPAASYGRVFDAALQAIGPMTDNERGAFLGGNGKSFYRL